jgi:phosphatidylinositol-3-phosphatase
MNTRRSLTRRAIHLGGLAALAVVVAAPGAPRVTPAHAASGRSDLKSFQHVFVIMMENTSYASLIGNANAPWINAAAAAYGTATNYTGVAHPSQPNYIAATSGYTNGVTSDSSVTITVPNLVDQLESHGKTWRAYMQSLSLCNGDLLASSCGNQLYERKHDPFISYADVQSSPARMANIVDFGQFSADLASNNVPDFVWISPDQCNDMHGRGAPASDPCSFSNEQSLIAAGDAFLSTTVGEIMSSRAWTGNSVIFITWDESDYPFDDTSGCCDAIPGGGHVVTLVISHSNHAPVSSGVAYNHYALLATIEGGWKLGCLGFTCDTANVSPMSDLVGPRG